MEYDIRNRRNNNKLLVVTGIGIVLWNFALKYLYAIQRLMVRPWAIRFPATDARGFQIDMIFAVNNPTSIELTFTGFRGKIYLNDLEISEVYIPRQVIPGGVSELRMAFMVEWQQLGREIIPTMLTSDLSSSTVTINGVFRIAGYNVPITFSAPISQLTNNA